MSKEPQCSKPITRAYNTYYRLTKYTEVITYDGSTDEIDEGIINVPIPEDMYIYQIDAYLRPSRKFHGEAVAAVLLVPGLGESDIWEPQFRMHTTLIIPAGVDQFVNTSHENCMRTLQLPFEAWVWLEKGDAISIEWKILTFANSSVEEYSSILFEFRCLVKG